MSKLYDVNSIKIVNNGRLVNLLEKSLEDVTGHSSGEFITIKRRPPVESIEFSLFTNSESAQRLLSHDGSDIRFTVEVGGEVYNLNPNNMEVKEMSEYIVKFRAKVLD